MTATPELYITPVGDPRGYARNVEDIYISTFCAEGAAYMRFVTPDGQFYNVVVDETYEACSKIAMALKTSKEPLAHPGKGVLLNTTCRDTDLIGNYADGDGNTFQTVIERNSVLCGYAPEPLPEKSAVKRFIFKARIVISNALFAVAAFIEP